MKKIVKFAAENLQKSLRTIILLSGAGITEGVKKRYKMLNLLLMVLMIAALGGMVVCNRQHRKSTKFQGIALGLLVVVIASGGMFMCRLGTLSVLGLSDITNDDSIDMKLRSAQGYVTANYIHNSLPAQSKILLISPQGNSVFDRALLEQLRDSGAKLVVQETLTQEEKDDPSKLITPAADRLAEAGSIDAAVAKHPDAKLVILAGISPSGESLKKLKLYSLPASRRPRLVIIGLSNLTGWVEKQLENGFFDALIVADLTKSALGITELPDNPLEVFNRYYVLITKDNLRRNRRFFHHQ